MAEVWQAEDELGAPGNRQVVVKILPSNKAADVTQLARFREEVCTLDRLRHEGIVRLLRHNLQYDPPYCVLEALSGPSLAERLRLTGPMAPAEAVPIIASVARALEEAHRQGVLHRDIKPDNIVLNNGKPKLIDFGIAVSQSATRHTGPWLVMGTGNYLAPERVAGKPATPQSDIYGLGLVLFELLAGYLPSSPEDAKRISDHVQGISPALESITAKALDDDPDHRHELAMDLAAELEQFGRGSGAATGPTNLSGPARAGVPGAVTLSPGPSQAPVPNSAQQPLPRVPTSQPVAAPQPQSAAPAPATSGGLIDKLLPFGIGMVVAFAGVIILGLGLLLLLPGESEPVVGKTPEPTVEGGESTQVAISSPVAEATDNPLPTDAPTDVPPSPVPATEPPVVATMRPEPRAFGFRACGVNCAPGVDTRVYPAGTTAVQTEWAYENVDPGSNYQRIWTNLARGEEWVRYDCTWDGPPSGVQNITLQEVDLLHSGFWQVQVIVEGQELLRERIFIEGDVDYWCAPGVVRACSGTKSCFD